METDRIFKNIFCEKKDSLQDYIFFSRAGDSMKTRQTGSTV